MSDQPALDGFEPSHGQDTLVREPNSTYRVRCLCDATWYRPTLGQANAALRVHMNSVANKKIGNRR